MVENWSKLECEAIVAEYLKMLAAECRGELYSKAEHRRNLMDRLKNRSKGSIEYKHQNISAVLIRTGHVYVSGYKPAWNYQDLLEQVVLERINASLATLEDLEKSLIDSKTDGFRIEDPDQVFVDAPELRHEKRVRDRDERVVRKINYAEREQANRRLGEKGEAFIFEVERRRLTKAGRDDLSKEIEWTSRDVGDGAGYDIRSFDSRTEKPFFIEVKTTNSGKYHPFILPANEFAFSREHAGQFALYRVFDFARKPPIFIVDGPIAERVNLSPTAFRVSF